MISRARALELSRVVGVSSHRISAPRPASSEHTETRSAIACSALPIENDSRTATAVAGVCGTVGHGEALPVPSANTVARPGPPRRIAADQLDPACVAHDGGGNRKTFDPIGIACIESQAEGRPARRYCVCGESDEGSAEHVAGGLAGVVTLGERRRCPRMGERQAAGIEQRGVVTDAEHSPRTPGGAFAKAASDELEFVHESTVRQPPTTYRAA